MDRILIAIDGSPGAREALATGLTLARGAGAIATVVYVRHAPLPVLGDPYYQRSLSQELMRSRVAMADAEALAATMGVQIEPEVLEGHPARCVLDLADARGAGLIVVGSRGRGAIAVHCSEASPRRSSTRPSDRCWLPSSAREHA